MLEDAHPASATWEEPTLTITSQISSAQVSPLPVRCVLSVHAARVPLPEPRHRRSNVHPVPERRRRVLEACSSGALLGYLCLRCCCSRKCARFLPPPDRHLCSTAASVVQGRGLKPVAAG